jgi:hypothetical protein
LASLSALTVVPQRSAIFRRVSPLATVTLPPHRAEPARALAGMAKTETTSAASNKRWINFLLNMFFSPSLGHS